MARKKLIFLMALFAYQTLRQYHEGSVVLPPGYKKTATLESPSSRRMGFIAESSKRIVIAFRGTIELDDLKKDLAIAQVNYPYFKNGGKTHRGFTELYESVRPALLQALRSRGNANKSLYITGHSLGGALAALCALDLANQALFRRVHLYTYGSPRVGDPAFAEAVRKKANTVVRVYNTGDWVTEMPPRLILGNYYAHHDGDYPVSALTQGFLGSHSISAYFTGLCREFPDECGVYCDKTNGLCP